MRRALAAALVVAVLASAVPQAQAALNKPQPFQADFPYLPGLGDNTALTVVSGQVEATVTGAAGSYGFFESEGLTIAGLDRECHGVSCNQATSIVVAPGGSVALCFPSPSAGEFRAGHVLGLFVDLAQDDDLNSFPVDKSLLAPAVDGQFTFTAINRIQGGGILSQACTRDGGVAALDDTTRITVRDGPNEVATLTGKGARIAFSGQPVVSPVAAGFYIIPFNGGCEATFTKASPGDAKEGLDLQRVQDLIRMMDQAHASTTVDRGEQPSGGNNTQAFLAGLLNGALLRLPEGVSENESLDLKGSHFVRFRTLGVTGLGNGALDWSGRAHLEVKDGKVMGAKPLVGVWLFQLPWWSYLLWAAAITLAIVRLVRKPDKNHPRWDPLRWVGWVATPVAWIVVFVLWDLEMRAVLGASLLSGSSGQFKLIVGLLQVAVLGLVAFAAAAPLRIIGRNSFLLAKQGTFMGISGAVAALLGFLFGAPYLRSYLGLLLSQVMDRLA